MSTNEISTPTAEPEVSHSATSAIPETPSTIPLPASTTSITPEEPHVLPPPTTSSGHPNNEPPAPITQAEGTPALPHRPEHTNQEEENVPAQIAPLKAMFPDFDVALL